jgi:hypothetical protein
MKAQQLLREWNISRTHWRRDEAAEVLTVVFSPLTGGLDVDYGHDDDEN